ncbi:MAG: PhzF family phenazine biosynthesis protein [Rhizobiaceae bacterium]|nr:PhzF family phenazine biosynthesis protein [Rhizobiaceae bacterium]
MQKRRYLVLDVFTDTVLEGNPLAVVLDCEGLDTARMQQVAAEFNLSETVFVLPARAEGHLASIRIFTPNFEMPFAGHPTVGSAVALARRAGLGQGGRDSMKLVLEEKIGNVRCLARTGAKADYAEFALPELSKPLGLSLDTAAVAAALNLEASDLGFDGHVTSAWTAGVPYVCVPVKSLAALGRASLDPRAWRKLAPDRGNGVPASAYVYCRGEGDVAFRARMFTGGAKSYEDPATGSALAAFSGAIRASERVESGAWSGWIAQGVEMRRPSRLKLDMEIAGGAVVSARIGGHAVVTAEGTILA